MVKFLPPIPLNDKEFEKFEKTCRKLQISKTEALKKLVFKFINGEITL